MGRKPKKFITLEDQDWTEEAKCRRVALELLPTEENPFDNFDTHRYLDEENDKEPRGAEAADLLIQQFCHRCPVRDACYDWHKKDRAFAGIAGGAQFSEAHKERKFEK